MKPSESPRAHHSILIQIFMDIRRSRSVYAFAGRIRLQALLFFFQSVPPRRVRFQPQRLLLK
jgi:hypothetical protein